MACAYLDYLYKASMVLVEIAEMAQPEYCWEVLLLYQIHTRGWLQVRCLIFLVYNKECRLQAVHFGRGNAKGRLREILCVHPYTVYMHIHAHTLV